MAALLLSVAASAQAAHAPVVPRRALGPSSLPRALTAIAPARPWVEGVTPSLENRLFNATYKTLPSHNILKVYVFDTTGFQSAGIRFSARVPHELRDLTRPELDREAVSLIRTTFDHFPELQTLDVWGTIPIPTSELTQVESTVFSVSADRETYASIRTKQLTDQDFLAAFGQVWIAPEVLQ